MSPSVSDAYGSYAMMPPFLRRCPECGHVSLSRRFRTVETAGGVGGSDPAVVECPSCRCQFEVADNPWLA